MRARPLQEVVDGAGFVQNVRRAAVEARLNLKQSLLSLP